MSDAAGVMLKKARGLLLLLVGFLSGVFYLADVAQAQDCTLKKMPLKAIQNDNHIPVVPITINGHDLNVIMSPGLGANILFHSAAERLGLEIKHTDFRSSWVMGGFFDMYARIESFSLGPLSAKRIDFFVLPDVVKDSLDPKIDGMIGPSLFHKFDVEMDLANDVINLFSQDHCPGQVVYWSNEYAKLPLRMENPVGEFSFDASIDGKQVKGLIDPIRPYTYFDFRKASRLFGLTADNPGVTRYADQHTLKGKAVPAYQYQFTNIQIGDVAFKNPIVVMVDYPSVGAPDVQPYLREDYLAIGPSLLNKMHFYVAYKERILYVTSSQKPN